MYNRKLMEQDHLKNQLAEMPLTAENIAYKPEEMITCTECRRSNPPHRPQCFYCGGNLEAAESPNQFFKPNLRKLEAWEKGFNIIFQTISKSFDPNKLIETERRLNLENEVLQKVCAAGKALPLARAESEREAKSVQLHLQELGIETIIVSDAILAVEKPPERLRGIEFFDDKLILVLFGRDEIIEIAPEDINLIVTGAVFERKISAVEEYKKKEPTVILETSETASDEILIDFYRRIDEVGYRIFAKGFDFSTLGVEKELLARNNIKKLVAKLQEVAPDAKYIDDYLPSRIFLATVWEVEQNKDSQGLKREKFGKLNLETITTVNNLSQFTKYSRLQRHLL